MKLIKATYPYPNKAFEMLKDYKDTVLNAIFENITGELYLDNLQNPTVAMGKYKDYHYLNGIPQTVENLEEIIFTNCDHAIFVANDKKWLDYLSDRVSVKHTTRYRLITPEKFDTALLKSIAEKISDYPEYTMKIMDGEDYDRYNPEGWEHNMRGCYKDKKDFLEKSFGVVIIYNGEIVCGCSAYTYYSKGVEVQIETEKSHRGKGLATIVGAQYILECIKHNAIPNWDAAHIQSAKMAQKLGFILDKDYDAYELKRKD